MSTSKLGEINQLFAVSIGLVYNITKTHLTCTYRMMHDVKNKTWLVGLHLSES